MSRASSLLLERPPGRSAAGLALPALVLAAPAPGAAGSGEVLDLARFGKAGELKPAVAEGLVDMSFYTQDMTAAAASRECYTAVYFVPSGFERPQRPAKRTGELHAGLERVPAASAALGLGLGSSSDEIVDVTVSLRSAEGVHNHLVRIAAEGFDRERLRAGQAHPLAARAEAEAGGASRDRATVSSPASSRAWKSLDRRWCRVARSVFEVAATLTVVSRPASLAA